MSERRGTKALELWCKRLLAGYNGVSIDNMTTSWRNGLAFCALVHRFRPDLIDFSALKPDAIYYNNELAFRTAETHLGIPALLDPEDMVDSEIPDRLSILTYLSQFYQRLGNTVTKSPTDNNNDTSTPSSPKSPMSPSIAASLKLGKMSSDVCTACGMPVYLAQRLIVSRKLYHRSCFRCSTCNAQLNLHACYENAKGTEYCCESCKNAQELPPLQEEDDRMGMVMFRDDDEPLATPLTSSADSKIKTECRSISDKIKLFEKNIDISNDKVPEMRHSWRDSYEIDGKNSADAIKINEVFEDKNYKYAKTEDIDKILKTVDESPKIYDAITMPDNTYKSDIGKLSFLQTQLSLNSDTIDGKSESNTDNTYKFLETNDDKQSDKVENEANKILDKNKINSNVPDDELEEKMTQCCKITSANDKHVMETEKDDSSLDKPIVIPPRRKKSGQKGLSKLSSDTSNDSNTKNKSTEEYPEHLNPFSDDELEEDNLDTSKSKKVSTNPFGSSDEEQEEPEIKVTPVKIPPPRKSGTPSLNPFWSGEEPSSDEEECRQSINTPRMYNKSQITSSTPNLPSAKCRRVKPKAPKPPAIVLHEAPVIDIDSSYSMNDEASLSSMSSHCSTINSETKPSIRSSPKCRKKRPAPTPPDSTSLVSTTSTPGRPSGLIQVKDLLADEPYSSYASEAGTWRRVKGPAPGLPLPGRRVVRPELTPAELQTQLDLLETQQQGLEKQGVLIEQMIRDKCEGEQAVPVPAEEVEDLVIQLCELVNEKNDLFRKQAELMYIRRQQRLEQEQADIEHEIRVIQSRPAVNRMDADKAREEQLVARLVDVVRLRDELVQQLDKERRREQAEDEAIALTIAQRRAQRNSGSISSSLQSEDILLTPKKSKVKEKMKKQIRRAKITLHLKKDKKDSGSTSKESPGEKKEKKKVKSTKCINA